MINVSENNGPKAPPGKLGGAAKWTKLLGGGSKATLNTGNEGKKEETPVIEANHVGPGPASDTNQNKVTMNDLSLVKASPINQTSDTPKLTVKPLSKWGRMFAKSAQEPIQESPEDDIRNNLKKAEPENEAVTKKKGGKDDGKNTELLPLTGRDISVEIGGGGGGGGVGGTLSAAEQHMLTSLYDIRLEIKEEMDNLGHKISRIDGQIAEILRFFSPTSTPCLSSSSTCQSSKRSSPMTMTASNSMELSPNINPHASPAFRGAGGGGGGIANAGLVGGLGGLRLRPSLQSSTDTSMSVTPLVNPNVISEHPVPHPNPPPPSSTTQRHDNESSQSSSEQPSSSKNTSTSNSRRSSKSSNASHTDSSHKNSRGSNGSRNSGRGSRNSVGPAPDIEPAPIDIIAPPPGQTGDTMIVSDSEDIVPIKDRDLDIL